MQAHATDLRAEVAKCWDDLTGTGSDTPNEAALDAFVHQVVRDWRQCTLRQGVVSLLDYTELLTSDPKTATEDHVKELREAGWSDRAIHDAVQVVSYFNYINRVADALGVEVDDCIQTWGE